jgi:lipopolysaccharide biosynthesis glycosyltransferase
MNKNNTRGTAATTGHLAIVVAVNRQYVQHLSAAIKSLLVNNPGKFFRVYVINSDIPDSLFDRLRNVAAPGDSCDMINLMIPETQFEGLFLTQYYSREIYYRLMIPELVEEERVLYMDSDVIVNGSVAELFDLDLHGMYAGVVREPWFDRHAELELEPGHRYFNSGVMLIDVRKWKEDGLHRKVIDYIGRHQTVIRFPDQDALNAVIGERYLPLPLKYNLTFIPGQSPVPDNGLYSAEELEEARNRPVIIHYSGGSKPWHLRNRHPFRQLYWKYLRMTSYRYALPDEISPTNLLARKVAMPLQKLMKKLVETSRPS